MITSFKFASATADPGFHPSEHHTFANIIIAHAVSEQTPEHGLGLSIARELARAHSGDLTLAKTQRDWTEFCLRLSASSVHVATAATV